MPITFTNIDVVSLVGALVGPFLAVLAAQSLVRKDWMRQSLMDCLKDINRHVLSYRDAYLARHPHCFAQIRSGDKIVKTAPIPIEITQALLSLTVELNNDVLALGLLLGNEKSKPIGKRLQDLIIRANFLLDDKHIPNLPAFSQCAQLLTKDIMEISEVMKETWNAFNAESAFSIKQLFGLRSKAVKATSPLEERPN